MKANIKISRAFVCLRLSLDQNISFIAMRAEASDLAVFVDSCDARVKRNSAQENRVFRRDSEATCRKFADARSKHAIHLRLLRTPSMRAFLLQLPCAYALRKVRFYCGFFGTDAFEECALIAVWSRRLR